LSTRRSRILLEIHRFADFLKIFVRNRRGILGIAIIVTFVAVALGANIITPHSPTAIVIFPKTAYRYSKPFWYGSLFPAENISQNIDPIPDPNFNAANGIDQLQFDSTLANQDFVHSEFAQNIGYPDGSGPGSGAIKFARGADTSPYGVVNASLTKSFTYPYSFPPEQFQGTAAILVENPQNLSIYISLFIERVGSGVRASWSNENFEIAPSGEWIIPLTLMDSDNYYARKHLSDTIGPEWFKDPVKIMFNTPGEYRFGVEVTFNDTSVGQSAEATVYIDDLWLRVFGNSYGLLGTDQYGRDIFTQLAYGTRISMFIGLVTAFLTTVIGLGVGITAGYVGGYVDQVLMRFTDMLLVIPEVALFIVLIAVAGASIWNLIWIMVIVGWTGFARIARSQTLSLKERPFVEAAKAVGGGKGHIIFRHIVPNVMSLVYVSLATAVPGAIINEAWLSFLGLYDPSVMTWGRMLHDVESSASGIYMWWWVIPPGLCIAAISLSFILIGYALDDVLNPKLRERR
jgi:ABC-type dipeptide/oligopeptide/nickel transport system permease subunit